MTEPIKQFSGDYRWLSNFSLCKIVFDGDVYPSVENAYQASKTLDPHNRKVLMGCPPGDAKRAGKHLILRDNWDKIKLKIMEDLVRQKFANPKYRGLLAATGDRHIEEGNYWGDTYWGIDIRSGKGENKLGKIIMKIRAEILEPIPESIEPLVQFESLVHFDIPEFLLKIPPWEQLIPKLGEIVTVGGNVRDSMLAPKLFPGAFLLNADMFRISHTQDRMMYRELLRKDYQAGGNDVRKSLDLAVRHMMQSKATKVVVFTKENEKTDFVVWEVRRALIGLINQACKVHTQQENEHV